MNSPYDILYIGRKAQRELAKTLLKVDGDLETSVAKVDISNRTVLVSEISVPGALSVPWKLSTIIPLGRTIDEITAGYGKSVRQFLRTHRTGYHIQQVFSDAEIDRANREMLQPYAMARHGAGAGHFPTDSVRRLAKKLGRLDFVLLGDEVVACKLGKEVIYAGKRYWNSIRVGYPEAVFSNPKRLREVNAINTHLALEWAIEHGFDYYDIGVSKGYPDNGLLQWKRSRGGLLDTMGNHSYFYVRLPKEGTAQFLWESPLFAVEHHNLTLHLGLPDGPSDEEIAVRYREMGFGGLFKIHLHCTRLPSERLLEKLRSLYTHQKSPPILEIIPSTS
jgi:hypothetical protein